MASTASTINVDSGGTLINFAVESEPTPPNVSIKKTSNSSWITVPTPPSLVVKVDGNDTNFDRTGTIELTASTPEDPEYNGIATETSSYTITQGKQFVVPSRYFRLNLSKLLINNTQSNSTTVQILLRLQSRNGGSEQYSFGGMVNSLSTLEETLKPLEIVIANEDTYVNFTLSVILTTTSLNLHVTGPGFDEYGTFNITYNGRYDFSSGSNDVEYDGGKAQEINVQITD